jgi:hypothetical protein
MAMSNGERASVSGAREPRGRRHETVVATHERIAERGQVRYDWEHYIPLVRSANQVRCETAPPSPIYPCHCSGSDRDYCAMLAATG